MERKHAIVMGGSMAGLLAARVLSDHCEQVTLIGRDPFPAQPQLRRGVPQGRHTHGLLASGRGVLEWLSRTTDRRRAVRKLVHVEAAPGSAFGPSAGAGFSPVGNPRGPAERDAPARGGSCSVVQYAAFRPVLLSPKMLCVYTQSLDRIDSHSSDHGWECRQ